MMGDKVRLLSVQVSQVKTYGEYDAVDPLDQRWTTGFFKETVSGATDVSWLGLNGDAQADLRFHGGRDKAVLAYSADHLPDWRRDPDFESMSGGAFGENLTVTGCAERDVCIGDRWRLGTTLLEVTQPRQPCWKLGRRWRRPDLTKKVAVSGRTGWYLRVIEPGSLEAGQTITVVERPHPQWTIAEANRLMYRKGADADELRALIALPQLSRAWKDELGERVMV
jgi:MOSC domain-containing protein YiiM